MSNPPDNIGLLLSNMNHTVNKSRYEGFEKAFEAIGEKPSEKMIYTAWKALWRSARLFQRC